MYYLHIPGCWGYNQEVLAKKFVHNENNPCSLNDAWKEAQDLIASGIEVMIWRKSDYTAIADFHIGAKSSGFKQYVHIRKAKTTKVKLPA